MPKKKYGVPDDENPEWTREDVRSAQAVEGVFPPALRQTLPRRRGAQKAPTKRLISLRVDADVLERYRASGKGWQRLMNEAIAANAPRARRSRSRRTGTGREG
jgi:uncharacterized protein (DUF4415 family)